MAVLTVAQHHPNSPSKNPLVLGVIGCISSDAVQGESFYN